MCGYVCNGSSEKLKVSLIEFDTDWFAECFKAFDEPFDIFQWEEEVGHYCR